MQTEAQHARERKQLEEKVGHDDSVDDNDPDFHLNVPLTLDLLFRFTVASIVSFKQFDSVLFHWLQWLGSW